MRCPLFVSEWTLSRQKWTVYHKLADLGKPASTEWSTDLLECLEVHQKEDQNDFIDGKLCERNGETLGGYLSREAKQHPVAGALLR